jgi:dodecin
MAKKQDATTRTDKVYKRIDLVGTSRDSIEAAISNAISRAGETVTNLRWFEIKEVRGAIDQQRVTQYQVVLTVGFEVK